MAGERWGVVVDGGATVVRHWRLHGKVMEAGGRRQVGGRAGRGVHIFFISWRGRILPPILPSTILPKIGGIFWIFGPFFCYD
jgi:hypothetical protein